MERQRPSTKTKSAFRNFNFRFWSTTNHMLQIIFIIDRMMKVYPKGKEENDMAFYLKQQSNKNDYNYKEFIVDTDADIADLPTEGIAPGSNCFVIETSTVYMLNNQNEWKEI